MSDLSEINKALMAQNDSLEEFKKRNDAKHAARDAQFETFLDFKKRMETSEAKATRPLFGGSSRIITSESAEDVEGRKSLRQFMQTGELEQKAMSTTSGPDGGYAVPKVIDTMIESLVVNISPIRSIATIQQTTSPDFHKLVNTRGTASGWVGESSPRTATGTPQLVDVAPPMGELYAFPQASQRMLDDAYFDAESWLAGEVATEFARAEGLSFISGNGANQAMGFLSGPAPVATADATRPFGKLEYKPTGVDAGWPVAASGGADLLLTLIFSVKAPYRANACFVMTKKTLSTVTQFKDSGGRYILTPMTQPAIPPTIFGFPVIEAEDMPEVASGSFSIAFGDFRRGYLIVDRIGVRVVRDPFTSKPNVGFYVTKRTGGNLQNTEAIKLIKFSVS